MNFEKIVVLGAGAIGSSYGALLSKRNDVTLIGRRAHVDAVNSNGLIVSGDVNGKFALKASTRLMQVPSNTLIILATKAQDCAKAMGSIRHLLKDDTVVLALQNGLGIKEIIKKMVDDEATVTRGLVLMAAEFMEPGKVTLWRGETVLESSEAGRKIAELFGESGLETRVSESFNRELWNKVIINCVVNPLTAIFKVRNYEIGAESLRGLRHKIVEECVNVGRAEGVDFEQSLAAKIDNAILTYRNYSSMCQDILKGKKTEIDYLNGKMVELGKEHHIPTPVNEMLVHLIKFLEGRKR